MNSQLALEYQNLRSAAEIAEKYGMPLEEVKHQLRASMSTEEYMHLAHKIGAKKVSENRSEPGYRLAYSEKMRKSVQNAIRNRMKNNGFRTKWRDKAIAGSIKGNAKISNLLRREEFRKSWIDKCSKGGKLIRSQKRGIFSRKLRKKREAWSKLGIRRTGRKQIGPLGENMYNRLEAQVAKIILATRCTYQYEKRFQTTDLNGWVSVDFLLKEHSVLIEVTYWDKPTEKCEKLNRKFSSLSTQFPGHVFVVVTKKSLCDTYKRALQDSIIVLAPNQLEWFIAGMNESKQ